MTSTTTNVSIAGDRTTLVFGASYRVRYGKDDKVLADARLEKRAANGDLVFAIDGETGTLGHVRVRPSTIDAIFGAGTEKLDYQDATIGGITPPTVISARRGDETAAAYLTRLERGLGAGSYGTWVATEAGQRALEEVAREESLARNGRVSKATLAADAERQRRSDALVEAFVAEGDTDPDSVAAKVHAELGSPRPARTAKPYSERNQVWRCATCHRRTRQPSCTGTSEAPHDLVDAPAGKRRDAR